MAPAEPLALEVFTSLLGERFSVANENGSAVHLRLTEVTALPHSRGFPEGAIARGHFALLFSGPAESLLPQGTYDFSHARFGTHAIFIVPVARDATGVTYEAIFG